MVRESVTGRQRVGDVITTRAKELRRRQTPTEQKVWSYLRTRPGGLKFRRQQPVGPFILDFYCASIRVGLELDGDVHTDPTRDAERDAFITSRGITMIRIKNGDWSEDALLSLMKPFTPPG